MDLGIKDRVALVSGGSRGIGRAVAEMLAEEGCRVVVVSRRQASVDKAVEAIRQSGATVAGVAADMTDKNEVARVVAYARETFGAPEIVVTNVHIGEGGADGDSDFESLPDADYFDGFNAFTMSIVYLAREVIPDMKKRNWGRIISIGSGAAKEPPKNIQHLLHNIARAPAVVLNKSLANDLGRYGITVNTIGTGWIATEAVEKFARDMNIDDMDAWVKDNFSIPMGRLGQPREEAALVTFLASELAGFITGNFIPVDGGDHHSAW
jgi:3-oxoacyl-[acyl-carrier protein] reductase